MIKKLTVIAHLGSGATWKREAFGPEWTDTAPGVPWAGNHCATNQDVLRRDLTRVRMATKDHDCVVASGTLNDPYSGTTIKFVRKSGYSPVQIDHVLPLKLAWMLGAANWTSTRREQIGNDALDLLAVAGKLNSAKRDEGPAAWMPPKTSIDCAYSVRFAQVALKYSLPVSRDDKKAMLHACR